MAPIMVSVGIQTDNLPEKVMVDAQTETFHEISKEKKEQKEEKKQQKEEKTQEKKQKESKELKMSQVTKSIVDCETTCRVLCGVTHAYFNQTLESIEFPKHNLLPQEMLAIYYTKLKTGTI